MIRVPRSMLLSIITVSWNVKDLVTALLESIFKFTQNLDFEIIVVDNNSADGTVPFLQNKFKTEINTGKLRIIGNHDNAGFSKANNQGWKIARGNYILFMNPDMELTEDSFSKLINFLEKNSDIEACTCRLVYGDRSLQRNVKRNPTLVSQVLILLKLHHFLKNLNSVKKYLALDFDYEKQQSAEQAMGAFILARRALMEKIHGWDEDYWLMWDDVELCKRVAQLGKKIIYSPITTIIHHESKCFAQIGSLNKQKRFNRGMLLYFRKHHSIFAYFILWLLQPLSYCLAFITQILHIKQRPQSGIKINSKHTNVARPPLS